MYRSLPFYIGLRYLRAKRRNHFISFISALSMAGLTLGVMVLIIVLSVMNGFDQEMRNRILGMVPHATISLPGEMTKQQEIIDKALQHPLVEGASEYIETQGMVIANNVNRGALFSGINTETIASVSILPEHIVEGSLEDLANQPFGAILGTTMAHILGVDVGDKVTLIVPELSVNIASIQPRFKRFTVVGLFEVGAEMDAGLVVTNIDDLGKLMLYGGAVDGVQLKTSDLFKARQTAFDVGRELTDVYYVSDWTRTQGNLFKAIQMEKKLVGLLLFMIIAVAGFNTVSSLVMLVTDKQAEIAVLRTLGATRRQILAVFMVQGTAIGLVGIIIGVILGVIGALSVADIIAWIESVFHIQFLDANVYFISYIPSQLKWSDVYLIAAASFCISVCSTIYPAWKASRISPAEALRYES
ncbi:lipoprotein-releasing ABC transporter permease subunit [Reinekea thalattae]|uniref:Lipoprotein-releasing ABC transporter permease subunit n=1 Tax=Reinekea thalattae TaxID=2593301 RepID=A0A5C8Z5Z9_9GAMM|nr:lipoprotein-releasing ABC transporter permease subunit [Reinekea thalattae]TXR53535.1 lipoprotein-releasing ABC transporter permease subunit [Reinekea thalattae]